jgi:Sec-independent protein translocase protein TatA
MDAMGGGRLGRIGRGIKRAEREIRYEVDEEQERHEVDEEQEQRGNHPTSHSDATPTHHM